ncbi:hypothetical protein Tco_0750762 [Tanacetum coccineum]|uniref:RNA-directed DNA polymerase, eukaryota, Reverse transcriptase zinc-binding domain protein n=1 Tax=Tanacetum coccineum TaxID=301880 RepID=A0ABQ4Z3L6_9ASTR
MLWARVIIAIRGVEAGLDLKGCNYNGVWSSIISSYSMLHDCNFLPMGTLCRKVGNGASIRFWKDSWNGNGPLMSRFNRLYHLDANEECLLSDRSVHLCDRLDSWSWSLDDNGIFSVHVTRVHLDVTPLNLGSSGMLNIRGRYFIDQ